MKTTHFPLIQNLAWLTGASVLIAVLMSVASLSGIFFANVLYPGANLRRSFLSNDVVNLGLGLPILLGSVFLARKGNWFGGLFWPGVLLYVAYNYIAYAVAMPFTWQFVLYLILALLSGLTVYWLLKSLDVETIRQGLRGQVAERFCAGVLVGFGLLFFVMRLGILFQQQAGPETAVAVADLLTMPLWVAGGILLWRKQAFGYACGAGLLFQASMLFIGLLVFFALQPLLAGIPFPLEDFVVIAAMGALCFVPFGLFVRGILRLQRS